MKSPKIPPPAETPTPNIAVNQLPKQEEVGGPKGLEPTRYGDWERKGRASDF